MIKKIKVKKFIDEIQFHNFCIHEFKNISFIFSLHFLSKERFKISKKFLQSITKKWCVIGHGMDSFIQFKNEDTYLDYKVNFFFFVKFFFKRRKKIYSKIYQK